MARDYVALILEIGEREPGYVDAYYGPPEWAEAAKAHPREVPALIQGAASLTERLNALSTRGAEPAVAQRKAYLLAHVSAASARLRMIGGERMSFADEAYALFGVRPELKPLSDLRPDPGPDRRPGARPGAAGRRGSRPSATSSSFRRTGCRP